jgi:hypothetical protein
MPELDRLEIDSDERGFHLVVTDDDGERFVASVGDVDAARAALRKALEPLDDYAAERDREFAAYRAASPEERDRVLGRAEPETDEYEVAAFAADLARKRERGE